MIANKMSFPSTTLPLLLAFSRVFQVKFCRCLVCMCITHRSMRSTERFPSRACGAPCSKPTRSNLVYKNVIKITLDPGSFVCFFISRLKTTIMLYYTMPFIVKKDIKSPGLHYGWLFCRRSTHYCRRSTLL